MYGNIIIVCDDRKIKNKKNQTKQGIIKSIYAKSEERKYI